MLNSTLPLVMILLGAPGSGKGTQARRLSSVFQLPHISTGDIFRENISQQTDLGKEAQKFIQKGHLVPDSLVLDMVFERISQPDCMKGYILDGFPRTIVQAEEFEKRLSGGHVIVLYLDVPDEVIVTRAAGRYICTQCGSIYNKSHHIPRKEGICDSCGGVVIQRTDDRPEVVKERLKTYHLQTFPLLSYYGQRGLLKSIDGTSSPDVVHHELKNCMEGHLSGY